MKNLEDTKERNGLPTSLNSSTGDGWTFYRESFITNGYIYKQDINLLKEAVTKRKGSVLKVTLPVGVVDRKNENNRLYQRKAVELALKEAEGDMVAGGISGAHGRHPKEALVDPDEITHLVTKAWVDTEGFIWNEWLVIPEGKGKHLAQLFLSGARLGISTRGYGMSESKNNVTVITRFKFFGADTVATPSAGIYAGLSIPKVEIEMIESVTDKQFTILDTYIIENKSRSEQEMKEKETNDDFNAKIDTVLNEVKSMKDRILVTESKEELKESNESKEAVEKLQKMQESLEKAKAEITVYKTKIEEITSEGSKVIEEKKVLEAKLTQLKEAKEEITKVENEKKELEVHYKENSENLKTQYDDSTTKEVEEVKTKYEAEKEQILKNAEQHINELTGYSKKGEAAIEELVQYSQTAEKAIEALVAYANKGGEATKEHKLHMEKAEIAISKLTGYSQQAEDVLQEAVKYIHFIEDKNDELVEYSHKAEGAINELVDYACTSEEAVKQLVAYVGNAEHAVNSLKNYALNLEAELNKALNYATNLEEALWKVSKDYHQKIGGVNTKKEILNAVEHVINSNAKLGMFKEELLSSASVSTMRNKVNRYLGIISNTPGQKIGSVFNEAKVKDTSPTKNNILKSSGVSGWK